MSRTQKTTSMLSLLLVLLLLSSTNADDKKAAESPSPAEQYRALVDAYEQDGQPGEYAKRFLQLAEKHPRDPVAVKALIWVLKKRRTRPEAGRALELLTRDHVQGKAVASACPQVERTPSRAAEALLRAVLEKNPHKTTRAQACLHLAGLLKQQADVIEELKRKPELAPRVLSYYGKDYGKYLASLDAKKIAKQREKVYERMRDSFADVRARDSTMGELAAEELFKIRHLSIGRTAPDIEGEDIFGRKFRLSEYRGKVVVLSFWGHW